jgi:3-methyladenine DNA glycosylase/8-oxoguanine DNA glycosylase
MSHNLDPNSHKPPSTANPEPKTELAPALKLYNALTTPNTTDKPLTEKAKATARRVGERADEMLRVEPSRNTEQYREDERRARAMNDPNMSVSMKVQLRGRYGDVKKEDGRTSDKK